MTIRKFSISEVDRLALIAKLQTGEPLLGVDRSIKEIANTTIEVLPFKKRYPEDHAKWAAHLGEQLGLEITEMRLHIVREAGMIDEHVDTMLPQNDTLIARLDENTSPRLTINGERVEEETAGTGYFLPEGTPHGVLPGNPGDGDRYSLVIWTKRAA